MDPYRTQDGSARLLLTVPILPPRVLGIDAGPADYLQAEATASDVEGRPCRFEKVSVEGGRVEEDLWVTSDGTRVRFRVRAAFGSDAAGSGGMVRVVFRGVDPASEIVAMAPFTCGPNRTLVLPSGASTSPSGFYSGPSGPLHEILVNTDPQLHVGLRSWERRAADQPVPHTVRSTWAVLSFDIWLDASVPGPVREAPKVSVDRGRIALICWTKELEDGRRAQLSFDPRGGANRLEIGRHPIAIAWSVGAGRSAVTYRTEVHVVVRDDGTIELERQ